MIHNFLRKMGSVRDMDQEMVVSEPEEMTTYHRADGELISGEFSFVTELEWFDYDEEPTELVEEVWTLKSSRPITVGPTCDRCDEPASHWGFCEKHAREDDPDAFEEVTPPSSTTTGGTHER